MHRPCLQVSDHEWLSSYPELTHTAEAARALVAGGQGDSVVGHMQVADGAPITASRFLSLYELGGDDDMFSQGLPAEKVKVRWFGREMRLRTGLQVDPQPEVVHQYAYDGPRPPGPRQRNAPLLAALPRDFVEKHLRAEGVKGC